MDLQEERPVPPTPVEPVANAFTIQVFSRDRTIQEGTSFAYGDQTYGELAQGDIKAAVTFEGRTQPRGPFRLEWAVDGVVHDNRSTTLDHLMEYGDEPTVGTYILTLYYQKRAVKKFTFRITP